MAQDIQLRYPHLNTLDTQSRSFALGESVSLGPHQLPAVT